MREEIMRYKMIENKPKTCDLIFETGDELASRLKKFTQEQKLEGSSFRAIGASSSVKLGCFKWETKKYETAVQL